MLAWDGECIQRYRPRSPLIFQTYAAGIGTALIRKVKGGRLGICAALRLLPYLQWLPRLRRAGPSASLDKSCAIELLMSMITKPLMIVKYSSVPRR